MKRVVAGPNQVEELLKTNPATVSTVYVQRGMSDKKASRIYNLCRKEKASFETVFKERLDSLAGDLNHQGVLAIAGNYGYADLNDMIEKTETSSHTTLVLLDQIQDPGNLGAIVRSSHCLGADGIVITKDRSAPMTDAAVRASAGASEFVPIARIVNLARTIKLLKKNGYVVYGADAHSENRLEQIEWPAKRAVVLGNEAKGLRQLTRRNCDHLFTIPIDRQFESLNVSASASVILYQMRQNTPGD